MKKAMLKATVVLFMCFAMSFVGYLLTCSGLWETIAISVGITLYHFAMRLAVGGFFNRALKNEVNYRRKWFKEQPFEAKLYAFLHVQEWKKHMPTFDATFFDLRNKGPESVVKATCQAELVHEAIIVLSLLPILLGHAFGAWGVLIATSMLAALIDLLFVIMQRYNRPRLILLMERRNARNRRFP